MHTNHTVTAPLLFAHPPRYHNMGFEQEEDASQRIRFDFAVVVSWVFVGLFVRSIVSEICD